MLEKAAHNSSCQPNSPFYFAFLIKSIYIILLYTAAIFEKAAKGVRQSAAIAAFHAVGQESLSFLPVVFYKDKWERNNIRDPFSSPVFPRAKEKTPIASQSQFSNYFFMPVDRQSCLPDILEVFAFVYILLTCHVTTIPTHVKSMVSIHKTALGTKP